jgi:ACS family glucarate transporter-like MFS transporter
LAWLCAASLIAYMDRGCMAVAEEKIQRDLGLSNEEMAELFAAFFLTYALLQVPAAVPAQRWGTRLALPVFSTCWSLATGMCGLVSGYSGLLTARLGMGAAEAGIFPCATSALGRWFPSTRRGWACGLLLAFMGVGGTVGSSLSGYIVEYMSWRWMFLLYTVPGLAWAAGFWVWFRDQPREHRSVNAAELAVIEEGTAAVPEAAQTGPVPWGTILSSPALWLLGSQQFFRSMGIAVFMTKYPTFLLKARGASTIESGNWNGVAFAAVVVGSMVGGMMSDWILVRTGSRVLSRKGLGLVSTASGAGFILLASRVESLWLTGVLVGIGTLLMALSNSCGYALTIDMGGRYVAPVFAVVNSLANLGYVVFPLLVPWLLVWTNQDWNSVLWLVAAAFLAASACWVFFNPYATVVPEAHEPAVSARDTLSLADAAGSSSSPETGITASEP